MIIVCVVLVFVGGLVLSLHKELKKMISSAGKKMLIYLALGILIFAFAGLLSLEKLFAEQLLLNYIAIQILFLVLGILQLFCMEKVFVWNEENKIYPQLLFTLAVAIFGSIGFVLVLRYVGVPAFLYFFWTACIPFFIGFFFRLLWQGTIEFPDPVFQKWFYPLSRVVLLPDQDELRNPRIISLVFEKTLYAECPTVFKAKAPITMSYAKFFFHFINDYNQRHPEDPISFKDARNQPYGWYFYVKPNFFGLSRNINPELTILANHIRDHCTILCKRIGV